MMRQHNESLTSSRTCRHMPKMCSSLTAGSPLFARMFTIPGWKNCCNRNTTSFTKRTFNIFTEYKDAAVKAVSTGLFWAAIYCNNKTQIVQKMGFRLTNEA